MCLTNISKRKRAKKDIVVYKHYNLIMNRIFSTYWKAPVTTKKLKSVVTIYNGNVFKALHSFKYIEDCKKAKYVSDANMLATCIIPKGAIYYIGDFGSYTCFASSHLEIKKLSWVNRITNRLHTNKCAKELFNNLK